MRRIVILRSATALALLTLAGGGARAQTVDTTAAWRYVPLAVGNEWHTYATDYNGYWREYVQVRRTVLSEEAPGLFTVETTTLQWRDDFPPTTTTTTAVWHFDEATQRVMDGEWAVTPCPLDAPFGAPVACGSVSYDVTGGHGQPVPVGGQNVVATRKQFRSAPFCGTCTVTTTYVYAAGIGEVSHSYVYADGANTTQRHRTLRYARIGGAEVGEPLDFSVSSEESATAVPLSLSVYPNPVRASSRVRYATPTAGPVRLTLFDLLGREVTRLAEDVRPPGEHETALDVSRLAPGLYLARLEVGGQTLTRRITVVR